MWGDCPDHLQCYVQCSAQQTSTWLAVPGSKYGGQAYCQDWCDPTSGKCEHLAAVGQPDLPDSNFDNFGWALLAVFQIITSEVRSFRAGWLGKGNVQ